MRYKTFQNDQFSRRDKNRLENRSLKRSPVTEHCFRSIMGLTNISSVYRDFMLARLLSLDQTSMYDCSEVCAAFFSSIYRLYEKPEKIPRFAIEFS